MKLFGISMDDVFDLIRNGTSISGCLPTIIRYPNLIYCGASMLDLLGGIGT